MNYFLKKKKWLAWVIMLTFLFTSFMPSNIMAGNSVAEAAVEDTPVASNNQQQIDSNYYLYGEGNTLQSQGISSIMYYDQNGDYVQGATDITNNKVYVSTSKSIAPTGIENEFDITLQVKTKADIQQKIEVDKSAAVVVLFDKSKSMQRDLKQDSGTSYERLKAANVALSSFINAYEDMKLDHTWLSIVTFGSDVTQVDMSTKKDTQNWIDLSAENAGKKSDYSVAESALDGQNRTATASALKEAKKLLDGKTDVQNKYIILLTDGGPNQKTDDKNLKLPNQYVTGYNADGSKIYSSNWNALPHDTWGGTKEGRQYAMHYADQINQSHNMEMYVVGLSLVSKDGMKNAEWMKYNIADDYINNWKEASELGDLQFAFEDIIHAIQTAADAYTVRDPLGEYVDFVKFISTPTNAKDEKIVTWDEKADKTFVWDLKKTKPSGSITDGKGNLTYTFSYRVRLNNTIVGSTEPSMAAFVENQVTIQNL